MEVVLNEKMRRLFVSDLDGTLLRDNAELSRFAAQELRQLLEEGLMFTVATSRALPSIQAILRGIPLSLPVVELNGALLSDLRTGEPLRVRSLPTETAGLLYEELQRRGLAPFVATILQGRAALVHSALSNPAMKWYRDEKRAKADPRLLEVASSSPFPGGRVLSLTVLDVYERLGELAESIAQHRAGVSLHFFAHPYCPGFWELSVQDAAATKANGVRALQAICGLEAHAVTVFGDAANDRDLFVMADRSVAVANAESSLKQIATEIAPSNEEDGVIRWLRREWSSNLSVG